MVEDLNDMSAQPFGHRSRTTLPVTNQAWSEHTPVEELAHIAGGRHGGGRGCREAPDVAENNPGIGVCRAG
jgi:hypothetical protein